MKQTKRFAVPLSLLAACAFFATTYAAYADSEDHLIPYKQIATVQVPSGFVFPGGGFDISWVDSTAGRYYLADRGNKNANPPVPPGVDVLSTKHPAFLFEIPLPNSGGTNGLLVFHAGADENGRDDNGQGDDRGGTLVVGGTDSNTYFVDLAHPFAAPIVVSTGGNRRADELGYDPKDQIILMANPDEVAPNHPFVTFISTVTHTVLGQIIYDGATGDGPAAKGIEQPVWNGFTGKFYMTIPATNASAVGPAEPNGEVDEIDPNTRKITRIFPTTCSPAGLALIPGQRLITSCGDVLEVASGKVLTTVANIGPADEIWYNPGDERVYIGGIFKTPVINGVAAGGSTPYSVIATLPWAGQAGPPLEISHSVAADSVFNHIFVPVFNRGVLVFTDDNDNGNGPN